MVYTTFSTESAEYVLQLGNHTHKNRHPTDMFDGIDAMVVETGYDAGKNIQELHEDPQFKEIIDYCKKNKIPIFDADTAPKSRERGLVMVSSMLMIYPFSITAEYFYALACMIEMFLPIYVTRKTNKINKTYQRIYSDYAFIFQENDIEGRNAIAARKIEEYLMPIIKNGYKKPKIGMVWGAGHMGIEYDIKSKKRRDFTIKNWRSFNFKKYSGFDRNNLNKILRYDYEELEDSWKTSEIIADLFD